MLKKPGKTLLTILLVSGISVLLSSCFMIDKEDPADVETIARSTDIVRIYKANDFIDYNITVIDQSTFVQTQGIMRIQWALNANLIDPITPTTTTYPVLKETTTITYDDSDFPDFTVVRYINQKPAGDVDEGSIILYAIDDGADLYWLYDPANVGVPGSPVITPVIFDSPMAIGVTPSSPVEYSVMEGCGTGLCGTEISKFTDNFTNVGDTTSITTNLGRFSNPFEISFNGSISLRGQLALSVLGDIRHLCGTSRDNLSNFGNMYVIPEIGVIHMTNTCQNFDVGGTDLNLTINLRNTNIPLP